MVSRGSHVVVAMSGGVDSSVAAALLVEQGYQVSGVMMHLWAEEENRCCAPDAVEDARRIAEQLGIPFRLVDYESEFKACVVDYFVAEYSRGRTPNPCLACNRHIRFGRLLRQAREMGAEALATGHYAQLDREGAACRLRMGADPQKDQSYVLYMLGQEELGQVLFPVGRHTKVEVRELARQRGLPVAGKDESMEICFVTDDDYRRFLREHAPQAVRPGPILDSAGSEIGRHEGLPFYTIGQRRGLGIAAARPLYVIAIDVPANRIRVGFAEELDVTRIEVDRFAPLVDDLHDEGYKDREIVARIRHRHHGAVVKAWRLRDGRLTVDLAGPERGVSPGQALVLFDGEAVLGGGRIVSTGCDDNREESPCPVS